MSVAVFARDTAQRVAAAVSQVSAQQVRALEDEILEADRVFVAAAGRSLLAVKFFAMRLMQIGLKCFVAGEVCTPSVKPGDLLVVVSGSGETRGMIALAEKARAVGARIAVVTEHDDSTLAANADRILAVAVPPTPAAHGELALVPHGNRLEPAMIIVLDALACDLMIRTDTPLATLLRNHANLE